MKKVLLWLVLVLFLITLSLAVFYPDIKVTMTEAQVNEQVAKHMPHTKDIDVEFAGSGHLVKLQADNAKITFLGDGRISIYSDFTIEKGDTSTKGRAEIVSGISYSMVDAAFFAFDSDIKNFEFEEFNLADDDKNLVKSELKAVEEKVSEKSSKLKGFLQKKLSEDTFSKIEAASHDAQLKVTSHVSEHKELYIKMVKEAAMQGLGKVFQSVPLYKLDNSDAKQKIASMTLKDVVVEHGTITVIFSIAKFLSSLVLYCVSGALALLLAVWGARESKVFMALLRLA